jgi:hypothetical protein
MLGMFQFDPARYAPAFAEEGYVHIPQGLTREFFGLLLRQVEEYKATKPLTQHTVGDKTQALYQLPEPEGEGVDYHRELVDVVAAVCGLDPREVVLSERHIKSYDLTAAPNPLAHKDRFASQISVGFSVHVTAGSTLVLYPDDLREVNPFNSSTEMRASLGPDHAPEPALAEARRVEIRDTPGDVIVFRGHSTWHLRANPAGTTMLYLKLNVCDCDPLGEDPLTPKRREDTLAALNGPDDELEGLVPRIGRRVDHVQKRYNRNWEEVIGVVLWGKPQLTIDSEDFALLRAVDGHRDLRTVLTSAGARSGEAGTRFGRVRRLASRGILDLIQPVGAGAKVPAPAAQAV